MNKVLIITYYWPPSGGPGVQRALKFAKYLRNYGWEPIIYTPENAEFPAIDKSFEKDIPPNITILKQPIIEPYSFYKFFTGQKKDNKIKPVFIAEKNKLVLSQKIALWIRGNLFIPDARKFWIKPSVKYLSKYLSENKVDAIISTGPPHSVHLIALQLHEKFNLPWVADFRDPWTKIYFYPDLMLTPWADAKHHRLEKKVLTTASSVVTIGNTMKQEFEDIVKRDIVVITNGYDEDDFHSTKNIELDKKFSIVYIGTLIRDPKPFILWQALSDLVKEDKQFAIDLEIKLIGKIDAYVVKDIEDSNLNNYLTLMDYVPHEQVSKLQQQAQVLLMKVYDSGVAKGIITGKLFEYLTAKRPILLIGPEDGDAAKVINTTKTGVVNNFTDVDGLKKKILAFYNQYKTGTLKVNPVGIEQYSRKNLTRKLAEELDKLIDKPIG